MLQMPASSSPLLAILRTRRAWKFVMLPPCSSLASETVGDGRRRGDAAGASLCLFNLTRQAALGDFELYFQIDHL